MQSVKPRSGSLCQCCETATQFSASLPLPSLAAFTPHKSIPTRIFLYPNLNFRISFSRTPRWTGQTTVPTNEESSVPRQQGSVWVSMTFLVSPQSLQLLFSAPETLFLVFPQLFTQGSAQILLPREHSLTTYPEVFHVMPAQFLYLT